MAYKHVAQKTIDRIAELYKQGKGAYEIADILHIHFGTVYSAAQQSGFRFTTDTYKAYEPKPFALLQRDPIWEAEFRGFFYGEGCALIMRTRNGSNYLYNPRMTISVRDDDEETLRDIQKHIGGVSLFVAGRGPTRRSCRWYLHSWNPVKIAIEEIFLNHLLPAKKCIDIQILYEAILARMKMPHQLGPGNRAVLDGYRIKLQEVKRYKGSGS